MASGGLVFPLLSLAGLSWLLSVRGDLPVKPENVTCMARQHPSEPFIRPTIRCWWETPGQTNKSPVTYTLKVSGSSTSTTYNNASIDFSFAFPYFMDLNVWVEAHNTLGTTVSDHISHLAQRFVKTNPPSHVRAFSAEDSPRTLLLNWTHPIDENYMELEYEISFCAMGSSSWSNTSPAAAEIQPFTLRSLQPDTVYIIQVRCRFSDGGLHWSDWSSNVTQRTPEDRPTSKPDLWRIISSGDDVHERRVKFICKDPVDPNGRIRGFHLTIQEQRDGGKDDTKNASVALEDVYVNRWLGDAGATRREITELKEIQLDDIKAVKVFVAAVNAVGRSPQAELAITAKEAYLLAPVEELNVWPDEGQLWVEWTAPSSGNASEYVVEWVSGEERDWQRESRGTRRTAITGSLKLFVRYNISVFAIFSGWVGKPTTREAYLEEGVPSKGPVVEVTGKPGRNQVDLVWSEIPLSDRRGFITNYTIYYTNGTNVYNVTVPGNVTSYTLKSLVGNTEYAIWIGASTIKGSAEGNNHTYYVTTQKYGLGQTAGVVAGLSLGLACLLITLLCFSKGDVIKKRYWIPNPAESTIQNWPPHYPLKVETPKENHLSEICVLDECEGRGALEEDETPEEDQPQSIEYPPEDTSSGIGGSSCMSASALNSHQGGDLPVVASSRLKGQAATSHCQAPQQQWVFSHSESMQSMLDSEESLDAPTQEAGGEEGSQQEVLKPLHFCPLVEGSSAQWIPAAPLSNYKPQLGGYRPQ